MTGHPLDHLVYGVPDLLDGVRQVRALTGVEPAIGGRHEQQGTANYLLGLGDDRYLEIIGPDPRSDRPPRWFDLARVRTPRLLTWAIRPPDLDACVASARAAGYDPGDPTSMSRRAGSGQVLSWRLTHDTVHATGGTVPFLIDWGPGPHPSGAGLPQLRLRAFTVLTPEPDRTRAQLAALGVHTTMSTAGTGRAQTDADVAVSSVIAVEPAAETGLRAVLDTTAGPVVLT